MGGRPRRVADQSLGVILIDTSPWVEFLRDTGAPACGRVEALFEGEIAICDAVVLARHTDLKIVTARERDMD